MSAAADLLLVDGPVFDGAGWVEGPLALAGERVLALGPAAAAARGPATRVVSLRGRCALPGLHDAHTHLIGGALAEEAPDLSRVASSEDLAAAVRAWIAERALSPGEWVHGRGWEADRFPGGAWPRRADLDAVAPAHPVLLRRRDGHAAIANGAALARTGISRDTPDPPGGRILRGPDGEPTGVLLEDPAIELVTTKIPAPDAETRRRAVARVLRRAVALGITSIQDDPSYDERLEPATLYATLHAAGELPARISYWRKLGREHEGLRAEARDLAAKVPARHVECGMLKGYLDGSLGSRTALLHEDYADAPGARGVDLDEAGLLAEQVRAAHAGGFQVGLHAIGDLALTRALELFAAAGPPDEVRARRHRVEHAQLFRPEDVARLAAVGAVASVQPIHLASDLLIAPARVGPQRCECAYPWAALRDAGALLAFGTDYPIEPLAPLDGVYTALTRRAPPARGVSAGAFHPEQALSLEDCLRAYTLGAAEAAHQEGERGRLAPGYLADVAVFSRDLRGLPPAELVEVRCELTVRGGEVVFELS
ncbi:MAG: amidohydrolase [Planctomycetota bacterium]